ncbi:MAG: hypothetical protein L3J08_06420 [Flavobacteriaceae bacterium]|nr:hypothetical protein [Flavobacteriaceae bacterium]
MVERKNIDRVFQENLKDLDINPSKKVWNNIELHLTKDSKIKPFPLWQRLSGVAVAIVFLFVAGTWYFNSNSVKPSDIENTSVANKNFEKTNNNKIIPVNPVIINSQKSIVQNKEIKNNRTTTIEKEKPAFIKKPNNNIIVTSTNITTIYQAIDNKYIVNKNDFLQALKSNEHLISNYDPINTEEIKFSSKQKKWSVGPTVAPVYYNSLQSSGSPIDGNIADNSKVSENALSVGLKLNYRLTNKIEIQSGINKVELAYLTKNVSAVASKSKYPNSNINTKSSGIILTNSSNQTSSLDSKSKSNLSGDLNQSIEYLELPIEVKYNLYESKLGVGLVGGFSTFVLTNNSVSIISQNQIINLGEANNLNSINFSGNLGVDFDYKINENWFLNVAPMFKYQFNTYSNNSGNFQPYYFGVYSGLNYRF